ncbi:hypothetical protein GGI12_002101 [Dipsacomyces acuminosporus]|nr:hypothetical protein GGI12_002101 [Dipsacomyces acuminosporus]
MLSIANVAKITYASAVLVAHIYGNTRFLLAGQIISDVGRTGAVVCVLTMMLTYPREQRKARVLSLFLFLTDTAMALGEVIRLGTSAPSSYKSHLTAWLMLGSLCTAVLLIPTIAPIGSVVRDDGVYLLARQTSVKYEIKHTVAMFRNKCALLLLPYMFSYPFTFDTLESLFPNKLSVILFNIGSIPILGMAFVLDIGSLTRRRRGQFGFAITVAVTAASLALLVVLKTQLVDSDELPKFDPHLGSPVNAYYFVHYKALFYATCLLVGTALSCVSLFTGWIIGSLSNDIGATARFAGAFFCAQTLGKIARIQWTKQAVSQPEPNMPLYVGIGILAVSLVCLYYVVCQITDTNNWTLAHIGKDTSAVDYAEELHVPVRNINNNNNSYIVGHADRSSIAKNAAV